MKKYVKIEDPVELAKEQIRIKKMHEEYNEKCRKQNLAFAEYSTKVDEEVQKRVVKSNGKKKEYDRFDPNVFYFDKETKTIKRIHTKKWTLRKRVLYRIWVTVEFFVGLYTDIFGTMVWFNAFVRGKLPEEQKIEWYAWSYFIVAFFVVPLSLVCWNLFYP